MTMLFMYMVDILLSYFLLERIIVVIDKGMA